MKKNLIILKKKNNINKQYITYIEKNFLNKEPYYLIIRPFKFKKKNFVNKVVNIANSFGTILPQNSLGKKTLIVTPDKKKLKNLKRNQIKSKLRYHQTNLGGSIHSDGPQLMSPPKYILMGCINQSNRGGNSIIVNMKKIYDYLENSKKKNLSILKKNFFFERRGFNFSKKNILNKPIFYFKNNVFKFRYLREYIETAYKKLGLSLKNNQIKSLNLLDSLMNKHKFQKKYKMKIGDIIILNNYILSHGRTKFSIKDNNYRSLVRVWVK